MCDLNSEESAFVLAAIAEINAIIEQINSNAESVSERGFMDHEGLSGLLTSLSDRAQAAARWVAAKPHEHAGHHG